MLELIPVVLVVLVVLAPLGDCVGIPVGYMVGAALGLDVNK